MTKDLLDSVYNQIKTAVSGTTTNIFYSILPNEDLLKGFTVVYKLTNPTNQSTFDTSEAIKNYSLTIQINNPTTEQIINQTVFIKEQILKLPLVNSSIKYIGISDEDLIYDFDLKIYTGFLRFNLNYAG